MKARTENRCRLRAMHRRRWKSREACEQQAFGRARTDRARLRDVLARGHDPRHLLEEQRVPAAHVPRSCHVVLGELASGSRVEQAARRRSRQRLQVQDGRKAVMSEGVGEVTSDGRVRAQHTEDPDADRLQAATHEGHQGERIGVGPVQIVQRDEHRGVASTATASGARRRTERRGRPVDRVGHVPGRRPKRHPAVRTPGRGRRTGAPTPSRRHDRCRTRSRGRAAEAHACSSTDVFPSPASPTTKTDRGRPASISSSSSLAAPSAASRSHKIGKAVIHASPTVIGMLFSPNPMPVASSREASLRYREVHRRSPRAHPSGLSSGARTPWSRLEFKEGLMRQRWWFLSGVGFAVLLVAGIMLAMGTFPEDSKAPDADWIKVLSSSGDRAKIIVGAYVLCVAGVLFLWFASTIRTALESEATPPSVLVSVAAGSAIVFVTLLMVGGLALAAVPGSITLRRRSHSRRRLRSTAQPTRDRDPARSWLVGRRRVRGVDLAAGRRHRRVLSSGDDVRVHRGSAVGVRRIPAAVPRLADLGHRRRHQPGPPPGCLGRDTRCKRRHRVPAPTAA